MTSSKSSALILSQACGALMPGVGHDDIEAAQFGDTGVDGGLERIEVTGVDRRRRDALTGLLHQSDRLGQVFGVAGS